MAGPISGASAPTISRTRRTHGLFPLGEARIIIASSRKQCGDGLGVMIGAGTFRSDECLVSARCTPWQARQLARALLQAAEAVEGAARLERGAAA